MENEYPVASHTVASIARVIICGVFLFLALLFAVQYFSLDQALITFGFIIVILASSVFFFRLTSQLHITESGIEVRKRKTLEMIELIPKEMIAKIRVSDGRKKSQTFLALKLQDKKLLFFFFSRSLADKMRQELNEKKYTLQ